MVMARHISFFPLGSLVVNLVAYIRQAMFMLSTYITEVKLVLWDSRITASTSTAR